MNHALRRGSSVAERASRRASSAALACELSSSSSSSRSPKKPRHFNETEFALEKQLQAAAATAAAPEETAAVVLEKAKGGIWVSGLPDARPGAIVRFPHSNAAGLVLSLETHAVSVAPLTRGRLPGLGEPAVLTAERPCVTFRANPGGQATRIDMVDTWAAADSEEKGGPSDSVRQAILPSFALHHGSTASITSTAPRVLGDSWPTQLRLLDLLMPLELGSTLLLHGPHHTRKEAVANRIPASRAARNAQAVFVSIGRTEASVRQANADHIVVSSSSDPSALRYMAPFAGFAIAEYIAHQRGQHVLVVLDGVAEFDAARRELATAAGAPPSLLPGAEHFTGKCAKLASGGSITGVLLHDSLGDDEEDIKARRLQEHLLSLVEASVVFSAKRARGSRVFAPVDLEGTLSRAGGGGGMSRVQAPELRLVARKIADAWWSLKQGSAADKRKQDFGIDPRHEDSDAFEARAEALAWIDDFLASPVVDPMLDALVASTVTTEFVSPSVLSGSGTGAGAGHLRRIQDVEQDIVAARNAIAGRQDGVLTAERAEEALKQVRLFA